MRISPILMIAGIAVVLMPPMWSQVPSAPAGQPLIPEVAPGQPLSNLWYGVDVGGMMAGNVRALQVLNQDGTIGNAVMPVSVAVADMNGDGLLDIVTMDVLGYMRIYFNSGTKTSPKFTIGEMTSLFLTRTNVNDPSLPLPIKDFEWWVRDNARRAPRICLIDRSGAGRMDVVIGNYSGEILSVSNTGTKSVPDFKQPVEVAQAVIPTCKDSQTKWGNVFSPVAWDWNGDGHWDLLVGEGSYSANSIHLLLNKGTNDRPIFDENNRMFLAYGMGLEQLSPCVVDFNGDGYPDLLVTERSGKVAVYLNNGKPWKPGATLPFDSFIKTGESFVPAASGSQPDPMTAAQAGGLLSLGGICTIAAGDFDGRGLFNLVFGKANGRVAIARNSGTTSQPKFSAPADVVCETKSAKLVAPALWECDDGLTRGNFFGTVNVVKSSDDPEAQIPEGRFVIRAGYIPCANVVMPPPRPYSHGFPGWDSNKPLGFYDVGASNGAPANYYRMKYIGKQPLKTKTPYVLSMKVRGNGVAFPTLGLAWHATKKVTDDKIVHGGRGSASVQQNVVSEGRTEFLRFSPTSQWTEVRKEFSIRFENKDLDDQTQVGLWLVYLTFELAPGSGVLYIDDIRLVEKN